MAQDSFTDTGSPLSAIWLIVICAIALFEFASLWKVFTKAGKPGWAALIPFYNLVVMLEIAGRPIWWFFLCIIPVVNIFPLFFVSYDISRSFGYGLGFAIGLFFFNGIFIPILAWGDSEYRGPAAGTPAPI